MRANKGKEMREIINFIVTKITLKMEFPVRGRDERGDDFSLFSGNIENCREKDT